MGNCRYCKSAAGLFRSEHSGCKSNNDAGKNQIKEAVLEFLFFSRTIDSLKNLVDEISQGVHITEQERNAVIINCWTWSVDKFLEGSLIAESDEKKLADLRDAFGLLPLDIDKNGDLTRVAKSAIIREVLKGVIPRKVVVVGTIPINFHKDEYIIWPFSNTKYFEYKTNHLIMGDTSSIGIPITDGVYYNFGSFDGQTIETTKLVHSDTGWFVLTNKHLYFAGSNYSTRLAYSEIVSYMPFKDGIRITRDSENTKPQTFVTGDGWFTVNLLTNLAKI